MLDPAILSQHLHDRGAPSPADVRQFRTGIMDHYHRHPRPMPWRETDDPYAILVSEIMLQQTQVERVRGKYAEFMAAFPDCATLAAAPLELLLRVWQGLGYNRRAIALQKCARIITDDLNNTFPVTVAGLESLPGIGPYTARAVAAFAFGIAEPLIETNIRTVFIHFFFHGRNGISDRQLLPLVEATLVRESPRDWYYALMDYGVYLKGVHPNPGRRSRHHQRQSRFEGSNRQLRSRLLREVMNRPGISAAQLAGLTTAEPATVEKNLADLVREGFLAGDEAGYRVRDSG